MVFSLPLFQGEERNNFCLYGCIDLNLFSERKILHSGSTPVFCGFCWPVLQTQKSVSAIPNPASELAAALFAVSILPA